MFHPAGPSRTAGTAPAYEQSEAARRDDTVSSLYALDLDGDGHKELLVGDIASNNTLMIHNSGTDMDSQDTLFPSYDTPALFNGFHYHAYFDTDNDGLKDLLVTPYYNENRRAIWVYKNTGTNTVPVFEFAQKDFLQKQTIDWGEDACPVFFDYDADNRQDIVMSKAVFDSTNGNYITGLVLYRNTGASHAPAFELITDDYASLSGSGYASPVYPAFGDLDGDGDRDMLIGTEDGKMHYFQNTAPPLSPAQFAAPVVSYMNIDVGKFATPQLYDLDRDGLLDVVTGTQRGFVMYFRNRGTSSSALFDAVPTNDSLGCIVLQGGPSFPEGYTVPFVYDSAGSTRLLVAYEKGNIFIYDNIDGNLSGCFNQTGSVFPAAESSRIRFNITVSGADLNADGLTDIIVGQSTGGAGIYYQRNPNSSSGYFDDSLPAPEVYPTPANESITISAYTLHSTAALEVFNSAGVLIRTATINSAPLKMQVNDLPAGIYLVRITNGKNSSVRRFVVARN